MRTVRVQNLQKLVVVLLSATTACGIGIRRDLSALPAGQIGFDDLCGLQEYFDSIEVKAAEPPRLVSSTEMESNAKKPLRGGRDLFVFETTFQVKHVRRILEANWKGLPDELASAKALELEVYWAEKAGIKRVVTEKEFSLTVDRKTHELPYQVCISELIYGEPLYRQRRQLWGLPLPKGPATAQEPPAADATTAAADGGTPGSPSRSDVTVGPDAGAR